MLLLVGNTTFEDEEVVLHIIKKLSKEIRKEDRFERLKRKVRK